MKPVIDIESRHLALIKKILQQYLPPTAVIWAFGSRVKGTAKKFSDLDLAIDNNGTQIPSATMARILFDLEESSIPFKVDILDWVTISESFKNIISEDKVKLF